MNDEELREALRSLDPAATLSPVDPDRVARLLEDTMDEPDTIEGSPEHGTERVVRSGRGPLTWLVAAAAVVVIAAVGGFALTRGDDAAPSAGEAVTPDEQSVTTLTVSAAAGRCMVPQADVLAAAPLAFVGTVTAVEDGTVTLDPSEFYAGKATDLVQVAAPAAELDQLLQSVSFTVGDDFLVAANDGRVLLCGYSGAVAPDLQSLYDEAFAR